MTIMTNKTAELIEKLRSVKTEIEALEGSRPALEDALIASLQQDIAVVFLSAFGVEVSETKVITTKAGRTRSVRRSFNERKGPLEAFLKRFDEPSVKDALGQFVAFVDALPEASEKQEGSLLEDSDEEASAEASRSTPEEHEEEPRWGSDEGDDQP